MQDDCKKDLNIYQRIHAIMGDVSYVQKESVKVNNQYKFVSHDAVTSKIRPALLKFGVLAIPNYFDISVDGNRTNCSMSITFVNIEKPEDRIEIQCAGFGQGIDPQDKGAGKAMSYAYKYALLKVFALETGDDPEKDNVDYAPKVPNPPKVITLEQKREAATKKAEVIISEYKACKDLGMLADVQEKYHSELKRFSEGYDDLFSKINEAGLQVIASFDVQKKKYPSSELLEHDMQQAEQYS